MTIIEPRAVAAHLEPCFAGVHILNGNGDATGLEWIREAGLLTTPIADTNTHSVGVVRDALVAAEREMGKQHTYWCMPLYYPSRRQPSPAFTLVANALRESG